MPAKARHTPLPAVPTVTEITIRISKEKADLIGRLSKVCEDLSLRPDVIQFQQHSIFLQEVLRLAAGESGEQIPINGNCKVSVNEQGEAILHVKAG